MARNPNWMRDELILALDLYLSEGRKQLEPSDPKVIQLSQLLNQLPIHPRELRENKFRNPTGSFNEVRQFPFY